MEIEHAILRSKLNQIDVGLPLISFPKFSDSDPRKELVLKESDPRISFALGTLTVSSPSLRVYHPSDLDQKLNMAAQFYLEEHVRITEDSVHLPKLLSWCYKDFTKDKSELLSKMLELMKQAKREEIIMFLSQKPRQTIIDDYDWRFYPRIEV